MTTPDHASQPVSLDCATLTSPTHGRHQVQPRRRRESWLMYVMHSAAAPHRSSNQTRKRLYRRLFSYLDRASLTPREQGYTLVHESQHVPSLVGPARAGIHPLDPVMSSFTSTQPPREQGPSIPVGRDPPTLMAHHATAGMPSNTNDQEKNHGPLQPVPRTNAIPRRLGG